MRVKRSALLVADNDTSAAIVSSFATMPREDQAALLETLRASPPWMWWLDLPAAEKVVAILPELDPASRDLIENRLLPPWLHRSGDRLSAMTRSLPRRGCTPTSEPAGSLKEIAAHFRRLPSPRDPGRPESSACWPQTEGRRPPSGRFARRWPV